MSKKLQAHLAVLFANFLFGANFSTIKYIAPSVIQPFALNLVRAVCTSALLWVLYLFKPSSAAIQKKDLPRFLLCAAVGVTINQLFFVKGLSLTTSIHGALLMLATPIFITIIAAIVLKEMLNAYKITGLILGVSGAAILILMKDATTTGTNIILGDIFIIINAIAYAFYLVLVRPLMHKYTPVHVLRWVFTLGAIMIIPFGLQQFNQTSFAAFDSSHWMALAFVVIGGTFLAYLFNIYGVLVIGSSATGSYIYTQPVFAAVIAMIFTGEHFTIMKALAALLIFMGVFIATRSKKEVAATV
jgi:drug/metabolite transporter (DMT)-like permease